MDQIRLEIGQNGLKLVFLYQKHLCTKTPKTPFLAEFLFAEHLLSGEKILNEASLGGSPQFSVPWRSGIWACCQPHAWKYAQETSLKLCKYSTIVA